VDECSTHVMCLHAVPISNSRVSTHATRQRLIASSVWRTVGNRMYLPQQLRQLARCVMRPLSSYYPSSRHDIIIIASASGVRTEDRHECF